MATPYQLAFTAQFGSSWGGKTVTAKLRNKDGVVVTATTTGFTDLGNGNYTWLGTIPDRSFLGSVEFSITNGPKIVTDVNPSNAPPMNIDGNIIVDHNYGGTDELAIQYPNGVRVQGAYIWCFTEPDYREGRRDRQFIKAQVMTDANGRWTAPMLLTAGTYILLIFKPEKIQPYAHEIEVV